MSFALDQVQVINVPTVRLQVDGSSVTAVNPLHVQSTGVVHTWIDGGGAGDGAIQDGASSSIEATVFDYTTSNPLAVVPVTSDGSIVSSTNPLTVYVYGSTVGVTDAGGSLTVDGTITANAGTGPFSVTGSTVGVTDAGGSLTVDGTVSVTGVAAEDSAFSGGGNLFPAGSVRQSTPTVDTSLDADVSPIKSDDYGRIHTNAVLNSSVLSSTGNAVYTVKFAAIAAASSGQNVVVSTVTSKKIRVLGLMGIASAATNIYFTSGGSTVIFGGSTNTINLAANGGFVLPPNHVGWFETGFGGSLEVNLSAANKFSGGVVYIEVP